MLYDYQLAYYKELFDKFDLDILDKYTLVFENTLTENLDEDLIILRNIINTSNKKVLLMYDSNPVWDFEDYFMLLAKHITNVYLSSANLLNLWGSHSRIVYFPTFYFTQLQESNYQTFDKDYRFSFLSNKPRFHRIYFYHIVKDVITDADVFSVNNAAFNRGGWKESYITEMHATIGSYNNTVEADLPFITNNALLCNNKLNTLRSLTNDHSDKHIAYNSYFNITGETDNTPDKVFLTEKTWKAVRSGVMPVFLEAGDIFTSLEHLGFKFDNAINIKNVEYLNKIEHIRKCMSELSMQDSKNIYASELSNIKQNRDMFYDDKILNIFKNHIRDKLAV